MALWMAIRTTWIRIAALPRGYRLKLIPTPTYEISS